MKVIPENYLRLMNPADRAPMGKAGRTMPEIEAANVAKSEKKLQSLIAEYLRMRGIYYNQQPFGRRSLAPSGWPDFVLPWHGEFIALEVKVGTNRQSAEQIDAELRIKATGGKYYVVRSLDEVKRILDEPRME